MQAREIMTENPRCVMAEDPLEEAAKIMRDEDVGLVPVIRGRDDRRLEGVVTDRDIAIRHVAEGHGQGCKVREAMTREDLVTCRPDDEVDAIMRRMREAQVRRVPIVDGERLVGIVAQADLALDTRDDREVGETVERISKPGH